MIKDKKKMSTILDLADMEIDTLNEENEMIKEGELPTPSEPQLPDELNQNPWLFIPALKNPKNTLIVSIGFPELKIYTGYRNFGQDKFCTGKFCDLERVALL